MFVTLESLQKVFLKNKSWSNELKDKESNLMKFLDATCQYTQEKHKMYTTQTMSFEKIMALG